MGPSNSLRYLILVIIVLAACSEAGEKTLNTQDKISSPPSNQSTAINAVEIVVWAPEFNIDKSRINKLVMTAERVQNLPATIIPVSLSMTDENYELQLQQAAKAGEGPDIAFGWHGRPQAWARLGLLAPLDDCLTQHQSFENVSDDLWQQASWQGKTWGVPTTLEIRPLFFNKQLLGELGWPQEKIDALPDEIKNGEFTLDNMRQIAGDAIELGIVEPGLGYWPKPGENVFEHYIAYGGQVYDPHQQKLVIDQAALEQSYVFRQQLVSSGLTLRHTMIPIRNEWATLLVWHDSVAHGRVLFWYGSGEDWSRWVNQFAADLGGPEYINNFTGYALFPSALPNNSGTTLATADFYMMLSENSSSGDNLEAACNILAETVMLDNDTLLVEERVGLDTIPMPIENPAFTSTPFTNDTMSMMEHAWYLPFHVPDLDVYHDILEENALKVDLNEFSPDTAARQAVDQLLNQLGDLLIVKE